MEERDTFGRPGELYPAFPKPHPHEHPYDLGVSRERRYLSINLANLLANPTICEQVPESTTEGRISHADSCGGGGMYYVTPLQTICSG